jgi:hypothetical protein
VRKVLFIFLIIILATLTFSCTKENTPYEKISYGESFVAEKEIVYSDNVLYAQTKWVNVLVDIIGENYFADNGNDKLADEFNLLFLSTQIQEDNIVNFLQDLHILADKSNSFKKEKDALWQVFRESPQLVNDEQRYKKDLAQAKKEYRLDAISYCTGAVFRNTKSMGATSYGTLLYDFSEKIIDIATDSTKEIFSPDIYKILRRKSANFAELKLAIKSFGQDNFATLLGTITTILNYTNSDNEKSYYVDIFSIMKENDIKKVGQITAKKLKELSLSQTNWQYIAKTLVESKGIFKIVKDDDSTISQDKILLYLGDNMNTFCIKFADTLENIDTKNLPTVLQKLEKVEESYFINGKKVSENSYELENLKQEIAKYKLVHDADYITYYDNFWTGFLGNLENHLVNVVTVPENFYFGIEEKTHLEKEVATNKVRNLDYSLVNYDTVKAYKEIVENSKQVKFGYYKNNFPLAYYYITNILGINLI